MINNSCGGYYTKPLAYGTTKAAPKASDDLLVGNEILNRNQKRQNAPDQEIIVPFKYRM